ncbi:hypothetical protein BOTBODRAFT_38070 [Botryobasidium botryosum FD-172 SS1]|uniref:Uncharacterized protein n=1 Tax=Botryobasidium botryosum (strain FD-172 SS1) TaxID=930990 RepID=A0A067LYB6_BOTB1|nr:hypothetical protein BOTBODRAFT_38070 [Botryobasidium botryosum FD-172 SS1]
MQHAAYDDDSSEPDLPSKLPAMRPPGAPRVSFTTRRQPRLHRQLPVHKRASFSRLSTETVGTLPEYSSPPQRLPTKFAMNPWNEEQAEPPVYTAPAAMHTPPREDTRMPDTAEDADEELEEVRAPRRRRVRHRRSFSQSDSYLDTLLERSVKALEISNNLLQSSIATKSSISALLVEDSEVDRSLDERAKFLSHRIETSDAQEVHIKEVVEDFLEEDRISRSLPLDHGGLMASNYHAQSSSQAELSRHRPTESYQRFTSYRFPRGHMPSDTAQGYASDVSNARPPASRDRRKSPPRSRLFVPASPILTNSMFQPSTPAYNLLSNIASREATSRPISPAISTATTPQTSHFLYQSRPEQRRVVSGSRLVSAFANFLPSPPPPPTLSEPPKPSRIPNTSPARGLRKSRPSTPNLIAAYTPSPQRQRSNSASYPAGAPGGQHSAESSTMVGSTSSTLSSRRKSLPTKSDSLTAQTLRRILEASDSTARDPPLSEVAAGKLPAFGERRRRSSSVIKKFQPMTPQRITVASTAVDVPASTVYALERAPEAAPLPPSPLRPQRLTPRHSALKTPSTSRPVSPSPSPRAVAFSPLPPKYRVERPLPRKGKPKTKADAKKDDSTWLSSLIAGIPLPESQAPWRPIVMREEGSGGRPGWRHSGMERWQV